MTARSRFHPLNAVRVVLVVAAAAVAVLTLGYLAAMPPPPPGSDGFAHGMAGLFGGLVVLGSLGLAAATVVVPALLGWRDPFGFDRRQRRALRLSGALVGLGLVAVVLDGLNGAVLLLLAVVLAFGVVCATLAWRAVEVARGSSDRNDGEP